MSCGDGEDDGARVCPLTYDEYPSPSFQARGAIKLHDAVGQDAAKSRRHAAYEVESGVALLQVVPGIPGAEEVHAPGIEPGF